MVAQPIAGIGRLAMVMATIAAVVAGCTGQPGASTPASSSAPPTAAPVGMTSPTPSSRARHEGIGSQPQLVGEPINIDQLGGRIVFDDFEDISVMDVDGSQVRAVAAHPGPEFDGAWSPDGKWIAYRDSTRGINENDEIYVVRADGTGRRNITRNPANDWGPDWSPDGRTIVFNSDRGGQPMGGYLVNPDGSNLRRLDVDVWFEYPAFSPDGTRIVFMGNEGASYQIFVADVASGHVTRLADGAGEDGWPTWSPDGSTIAFSSQRDDCNRAPSDQDCWRSGDIGDHFDIWLVDADGSNERRLSAEFGQFVTWSPNGHYLLVSGYGLYVLRLDGTGRRELRAQGIDRALGGLPDWTR